jgi:hypothetical protein
LKSTIVVRVDLAEDEAFKIPPTFRVTYGHTYDVSSVAWEPPSQVATVTCGRIVPETFQISIGVLPPRVTDELQAALHRALDHYDYELQAALHRALDHYDC